MHIEPFFEPRIVDAAKSIQMPILAKRLTMHP